MILLTTSRRPTERIRAFCRDLANSIPDTVRVNRGKLGLFGVAEKAIKLGAERVVVVDRWRWGSGKINLFRVSSTGLKPVPPVLLMRKLRLRREFMKGSGHARSSAITLKPEDSIELIRISEHLAKYFGFVVLSLDEASKNYSTSMHLSFDPPQSLRITFLLLSRMVEIGPQVSLSKLVWEVSP